jgi:glycine/D-amino acid oxidase-like deaminating enzyme
MRSSISDTCGWISLAGDYADHPSLRGNQITDWAIIGGGFTGLAAARRLSELAPDARIVLIDGKRVGQGASGRNSGFVVANESPGHAALSSPEGRSDYAALNALDHAGVAELRSLVQQHGIDCQWEDTGSIHAAASSENFAKLHTHLETFSRLGIEAELFDADMLKTRLGTGHYKLGVHCRGGALVQPAALAKGLLETLPEQVEIFENTPVRDIKTEGGEIKLSLPDGEVRAKRIIVGVNAFMPRLGLQMDRVFPLALSASLTRPLTESEEDEISRVASWGILSPQSLGATMRLTQDRRILIRNTAEFRRGGISVSLLAERRKKHYQGLARRFPWLDGEAIEYTWSGNICVSRNSKPVFGEVSKNVFAAGCYNASGVARGSIMGKLIVDHALAAPSDLLEKTLSLGKPAWLPPRPFFDLGAKARLAFERMGGEAES